jgi:hypothetical protein
MLFLSHCGSNLLSCAKVALFHLLSELTSMLRNLFGKRCGPKCAGNLSYRPMIEALEDRWVPSVVSPRAPTLAASALTAGTSNGAATDMQAFYDDNQFTINFKQITGTAA